MNLSNPARTRLSKVPGMNKALDFICARANEVFSEDHDNETGKHVNIRTLSIESSDPLLTITGNGASKLNWLGGATGSSTAAAATNVFEMTFTGLAALSALDKVLVLTYVRAATANTANCRIFNSSDSLDLMAGITVTAGLGYVSTLLLRRDPDSNTVMFSDGFTGAGGLFGAWSTGNAGAALATGWTNSWKVALRHDGVTATGTLYFEVSVYRVAGQ